MKKQLLVGAFMLASFLTANAQEVLLTNNFGTDQASYTAAMTDWGIGEFDTDEDTWTGYIDPDFQAMGFSGVSLASATFINTGTPQAPVLVDTQPSNILLSSPIDLTNVTAATLTFKIGALGAPDASMNYEVLVITEAQKNDPQFDFSTVTPSLTANVLTATTTATDVTVSLTPNVGGKVVVVFHHTNVSSGKGYLIIDDIVAKSGAAAGVNENLISSLSVFPNPANDVINVANAENVLVNAITVTDLNGRTVKNLKFDGVANAQINVSDLASGMYMMTVSSDKGSMTKKFMKN